MENNVTVRMDHFKECKHSHRFQESTTGPTPAAIGSIYVPKDTLTQMGWKYGEGIKVTISL
jgi:hypothetical protein